MCRYGRFYLAAQKYVVSFPLLVGFSFRYLHEQITPNDRLRGVVTPQVIKVYKLNAGPEIDELGAWDHQMDRVLLSSHLPSHAFANTRY